MIPVFALLAATGTVAPGGSCATLVPPMPVGHSPAGAHRLVGTDDLVRLRDFGPLGTGGGSERFLSVSPDGRHVALEVRQANPTTNQWCVGLVVVDVASGKARLVDDGGDLVRMTYTHWGLAGFPTGVPWATAPSWSPDGRWLVMLKRYDGVTQVWTVSSESSERSQLTKEKQDVTAAAWARDGRRIIYRTNRSLTSGRAAIDREATTGWHYDDRFIPAATPRPYPRPAEDDVLSLDPATGLSGPASANDRAFLDASMVTSSTKGGSQEGRTVSVELIATDPAALTSSHFLRWRDKDVERLCRAEACSNARGYWIEPGGRSVLLLARSGWGGGDLTFYRWNARSGRVAKLSTTSDLLLGCRPLGLRLLCSQETSTMPRRLVLLDPASGRSTTIFNPNPEYDRLSTGKVERLRLTSANGTPTFADVMLPPGFAQGRRYPMVVVSYESRGFLRGGTGEEYPIPAFASAGMIVLSFQQPRDVSDGAVPPPKSIEDLVRRETTDWADRRNAHAALMDGVDQVIARGWVDEKRIGITGLSNGIAIAAFALLNSQRFSVAALSGCCEEPVSDLILQGPTFSHMMTDAGYPPYGHPKPDFWTNYSIQQNASRLSVPFLIQVPDRELLYSLPTVQSLRDNGVPVDLYVYPNEFHVKWQPAHRAAVYDRALRWFEFWFNLPPLPGQSPAPAEETARWRTLRERAGEHRARPGSGAEPTLPYR